METISVFFEVNGKVFRLDVPNCDADFWTSILNYDETNGTDFYDRLNETNVLGSSPSEYLNAIPVSTWNDVMEE